MKTSTSRILTTHTGSLPWSPKLQELLLAKREQRQLDEDVIDAEVRGRVSEVVEQQVDIGLDVINDGEQGRETYVDYVKEQLTGFEGERIDRPRPMLEAVDFPEFYARSSESSPRPACTGPIGWKDWARVQTAIQNLKAAASEVQVEEVFMTSASPGVIAGFFPNEYYPSEEAYLYALADAMKDEYNAIVTAGLLLQLDCPDLAGQRAGRFSHLTLEEFKKVVELHVEVINYAVDGIPPERVRMHVCWGNREGPHTTMTPLSRRS